MKKTGVLVVNLGTPDSPKVSDVRKYLAEFLMDGRVIDIPVVARTLLVRGIIVPFRSIKVSKEYKKLWMEDGSPLLVYGKNLVKKLQQQFANDPVEVALAMRYQSPSIAEGLQKLRDANVDRIIVFPLFPQYASATTGSVAAKVMDVIANWNVIPSIDFINSYHEDDRYVQVFADKVKADINKHNPDHILFSYHGIPERHLRNIQQKDPDKCSWPNCSCGKEPMDKPYCYRSACFKTTELMVAKLGLSPDQYSTSFQSRLGKDPWIQPYTDETVEKLAKKGVKNLLVVSPSFVADCLETTLEIGEEYKELFEEHGGEVFNFTESLNADEAWADAIHSMLSERMKALAFEMA